MLRCAGSDWHTVASNLRPLTATRSRKPSVDRMGGRVVANHLLRDPIGDTLVRTEAPCGAQLDAVPQVRLREPYRRLTAAVLTPARLPLHGSQGDQTDRRKP